MRVIDKLLILFIFAVNISTAVTGIAVGLMIAYVLYRAIKFKEYPSFDSNLVKLFGFYFMLQILVAGLSLNPSLSFREVVGEIHRCFPLFFAMTYIKNKSQLKNIFIAFIMSVLVNNFYAELQCFYIHVERAYAFSHTPTFYASFLLMQIPILIFIYNLDFMPKWSKILSIIALITSIQMLIATITRGAWFAFILTGITFVILDKHYRRKSLTFFAISLVISTAIIMSASNLQFRAMSIFDPNFRSNSERVLMWQSSSQIFCDYPIHGIGQTMFQEVYNTKYISPLAKERSNNYLEGHTHPHNNLINATVEGGLIGLFAFVILHAYFAFKLYQLHKRSKLKLSCGIIGLMMLLALQLEGLTDTNMNQVQIMREYWFLIGTLFTADKIIDVKNQS